ncbi:MAG: hypothetical protein PHQ28_00030 [Mycobacterium sp.]|nr:hypothetical protein [Mycobacterium sp.]
MELDHTNWYTVARYRVDGTVPITTVIKELEQTGDVIDVDEAGGYVLFALDKQFRSTAKDLTGVKANAIQALPRPQGCDHLEVINVTRKADNYVFEL